MKNYQLKVKQIKQHGKVCGYVILLHYPYGYKVQLHFLEISGYIIDKCFPERWKAENYFDKVFSEYTID